MRAPLTIVTMRWMLLVDTCGVQGSVGIADLRSCEPLVEPQRTLRGRETQEGLMRCITEVLDEAAVQVQEVDVLAVVIGPGSFTGVRIGLAAVKGLAEALGRPVVALSRLAVLAAASGDTGDVQAWIDAGRGDVFAARYRDGMCESERMMHGSDAAAELRNGDTVVVMEELLTTLHPSARLVPQVGLREAAPLARAKVQRGEFAEIELLDANYLRVPDAELARLAAESRRVQESGGARE